jgi:hypothetical protein
MYQRCLLTSSEFRSGQRIKNAKGPKYEPFDIPDCQTCVEPDNAVIDEWIATKSGFQCRVVNAQDIDGVSDDMATEGRRPSGHTHCGTGSSDQMLIVANYNRDRG